MAIWRVLLRFVLQRILLRLNTTDDASFMLLRDVSRAALSPHSVNASRRPRDAVVNTSNSRGEAEQGR
jgi:hypothetical protein